MVLMLLLLLLLEVRLLLLRDSDAAGVVGTGERGRAMFEGDVERSILLICYTVLPSLSLPIHSLHYHALLPQLLLALLYDFTVADVM